MDFDRPIESLDGWNAKGVTPDVDTFADNATATKFFPSEYFSYWTAPTAGVRANFGHIKPGDRLHAKVAISYVSEANAQENIARELPQWDFDATHAAATATRAWGYVEPLSMTPTWVHFDRRYGTPACSGTTSGYPTCRRGDKNTYVLILQDALNALGYSTKTLDGAFGQNTYNALRLSLIHI